jgi:hypothetical protein
MVFLNRFTNKQKLNYNPYEILVHSNLLRLSCVHLQQMELSQLHRGKKGTGQHVFIQGHSRQLRRKHHHR